MNVYQTDHEGFYVGVTSADPDPLQPGGWLIPGGCVTMEPPSLNPGQRAKWLNDSWVAVDPEPEPEPEPEPTPPTREEQEANRQAAYMKEADPLFFEWQAGEGTEQAWLEKREEIRLRYPYPDESETA